MDKQTERKEEVTENGSTPEFALMRQIIQKSFMEADATLEERLESRWIWGTNRTLLMMIRVLNRMVVNDAKHLIEIMENVYNLENRLSTLEDTIRTVPNLKKKLASLEKRTLPKEVRQYMNEFKEEWENFKELRDKTLERFR